MAFGNPIGAPGPAIQRAADFFAREHFEASGAERFGIDGHGLASMLVEVLSKSTGLKSEAECEKALSGLHLSELVITRACAAGNELAWNDFLQRYRPTLYSAAYKMASNDSIARELADSIYASLYGIDERGREHACKLSYYLGRGSLEGWLRTVVAQEFVTRYRRTNRETSLDSEVEDGAQFAAPPATTADTADSRIEAATQKALTGVEAEERFLLASYFLDGRTLAEIARVLKVHESTISRRLDKVTSELRRNIRANLIAAGMSAPAADEALADTDVRDLQIGVRETFKQETPNRAFYKRED